MRSVAPKRLPSRTSAGSSASEPGGSRLSPSVSCACNPPDTVADIIGDQERTSLVQGDADRSAIGFALIVEKSGQHVYRIACRSALSERHEDHLVAAERIAIPGAVLTHEHA